MGPLLFLITVTDMSQAAKCDLYLFTDGSWTVRHHKDSNIIKKQLNEDFSNICDWLVDNTQSVQFGKDKRKSILFASKFQRKNV